MLNKNNNTNNRSYKIVIMAMTVMLLGGLFYIYKMSDRSKKAIIALRSQKADLINDLKTSEFKLTQAIKDKSILSKQLIQEKIKLQQLISEMQNANVSEILNLKFQKQAQALQNRVVFLMKESEIYKRRADSANSLLSISEKSKAELQNKFKELQNKNNNLSDKIDEASGLKYYDFMAIACKIKSSGKEVETDLASKTNVIRMKFKIAENKLSDTKTKKFFIQIIDGKNNVLGQKQTIKFDDKVLVYSYTKEIKYNQETMDVESALLVSDLPEGPYSVNVFDGSAMILTSNFELK
jgi:hypothetical protein